MNPAKSAFQVKVGHEIAPDGEILIDIRVAGQNLSPQDKARMHGAFPVKLGFGHQDRPDGYTVAFPQLKSSFALTQDVSGKEITQDLPSTLKDLFTADKASSIVSNIVPPGMIDSFVEQRLQLQVQLERVANLQDKLGKMSLNDIHREIDGDDVRSSLTTLVGIVQENAQALREDMEAEPELYRNVRPAQETAAARMTSMLLGNLGVKPRTGPSPG